MNPTVVDLVDAILLIPSTIQTFNPCSLCPQKMDRIMREHRERLVVTTHNGRPHVSTNISMIVGLFVSVRSARIIKQYNTPMISLAMDN